MKNKLIATKNHVVTHRAKYAVGVTLIGAAALQIRTANEFNKFLKAKDLFDEYYDMNEV